MTPYEINNSGIPRILGDIDGFWRDQLYGWIGSDSGNVQPIVKINGITCSLIFTDIARPDIEDDLRVSKYKTFMVRINKNVISSVTDRKIAEVEVFHFEGCPILVFRSVFSANLSLLDHFLSVESDLRDMDSDATVSFYEQDEVQEGLEKSFLESKLIYQRDVMRVQENDIEKLTIELDAKNQDLARLTMFMNKKYCRNDHGQLRVD